MSQEDLKTISDSELLYRYADYYEDNEGPYYSSYLDSLQEEILSRMGAAHFVRSIPADAPNDVAIRSELPDGRIVEVIPKERKSVVMGLPEDFMLRALRAGVVTTMQVTKVDVVNGFFLAKEVDTGEEFKFPLPKETP